MFKYIISEPLKEKEPGLFDNQYKNNIKINKTFCWSEYCSCCTCLNNSKEEDIKLDIFQYKKNKKMRFKTFKKNIILIL